MLSTVKNTITTAINCLFSTPKEVRTKVFNVSQLPNTNKEDLLMGLDLELKNYKWQDEKSLLRHQLIMGQNTFDKYDMFLAKQAITQGKDVWICNFNQGDIEKVITLAKEVGRENDLRVFHFTEALDYKKYSAFLSKEDKTKVIETTIDYIVDNQSFLVKENLYKQIEDLSLYNGNGIAPSQIFYQGEKINIMYFGENSSPLMHLLASKYLSDAIIFVNQTPGDLPYCSESARMIFFRDMYLNSSPVVSYQAKCWKFSFNYSYPSIEEMKKKLSPELMFSIIVNSDTKILSKKEKDKLQQMVDFIIPSGSDFAFSNNEPGTFLVKKCMEYKISF